MLIRFKGNLYAPAAFLNICGVYVIAAVATVVVFFALCIVGVALAISDVINPVTDPRMK